MMHAPGKLPRCLPTPPIDRQGLAPGLLPPWHACTATKAMVCANIKSDFYTLSVTLSQADHKSMVLLCISAVRTAAAHPVLLALLGHPLPPEDVARKPRSWAAVQLDCAFVQAMALQGAELAGQKCTA